MIFFITKPKVLTIYHVYNNLDIMKHSKTYMFLVLTHLLKVHNIFKQLVFFKFLGKLYVLIK
jgi:hypothetical protein